MSMLNKPNRRGFISGLVSLLCAAPAIVRADSLMQIKGSSLYAHGGFTLADISADHLFRCNDGRVFVCSALFDANDPAHWLELGVAPGAGSVPPQLVGIKRTIMVTVDDEGWDIERDLIPPDKMRQIIGG